jgi:amino acid transporter
MTEDAGRTLTPDEQRLAELGYKQELSRSWSGFQNFAISFTIISVLAGCFTTYYQAWNNGGPVAISWGWPIISIFILIIAFCMAELVSAMPTAGGIYYWSAKLGSPAWAWFTGWFNLLGLIAILASVDYFAAQFLYNILGFYNVDIFGVNFAAAHGDPGWHALTATFVIFAIILLIHIAVNIRGSHLVAVFNSISVWWHIAGVAVIIGILIFVPSHHQSVKFVFTHLENNSGFAGGGTTGFMFWLYVLPLGFLLTQYTITGFDASAHISEETNEAAEQAPKGVWRSVFYSAVIGYVLLLAITFVANDPKSINAAGGAVFTVFSSSGMALWATKFILIVAFIGQMFCGMSCMTSASRMMFAFSRDGAVPGHGAWRRVNQKKVPFNAVIAVAVVALILTLPALFGNKNGATIAFSAVVSIGVIGLYVAWIIPIFLRLRMGDRFEPGPWTLGKKYKWMCTVSIIEVIIIVVGYFDAPFSSGGLPWKSDIQWSLFNYTPVVTGGVLIVVGIWWLVSAKNWWHGPVSTIGDIETDIGATPPLAEAP